MNQDVEFFVTSIQDITKKRRLVFINYEPAFALYIAEIKQFNIKINEILGYDMYEEIIKILKKRATVRAMALLQSKDYTRKGMFDKLKESYYPDEAIEHAFEYLDKYGYINDERFASNYVFSHGTTKAKRIIKQKLIEKGIDSDIIDRTFEEYYEDNDQVELKQAVEHLSRKYKGEDIDYNLKQKLMGFLYRKGYSIEIINKAIDIVVKDSH